MMAVLSKLLRSSHSVHVAEVGCCISAGHIPPAHVQEALDAYEFTETAQCCPAWYGDKEREERTISSSLAGPGYAIEAQQRTASW